MRLDKCHKWNNMFWQPNNHHYDRIRFDTFRCCCCTNSRLLITFVSHVDCYFVSNRILIRVTPFVQLVCNKIPVTFDLHNAELSNLFSIVILFNRQVFFLGLKQTRNQQKQMYVCDLWILDPIVLSYRRECINSFHIRSVST